MSRWGDYCMRLACRCARAGINTQVNTQVNVISDEQRVAALMALFARVRGAASDSDSAQQPVEQLPASIQ